MEPLLKPLTAIFGLIAFVSLLFKCFKPRSSLPLPPGPPGEPFIGHLRVVPKENTAATFAKWAKELSASIAPENPLVDLTGEAH